MKNDRGKSVIGVFGPITKTRETVIRNDDTRIQYCYIDLRSANFIIHNLSSRIRIVSEQNNP